MTHRPSFRIIVPFLAAAMLAVAIIGSVASAQTRTPGGFHPAETRTGNAAIDPFIEAIVGGDGEAVTDFIDSEDDPFSLSACEPELVDLDEARAHIAAIVEGDPLFVYAVYSDPPSPSELAAYRVLVGSGEVGMGVAFDISEDGTLVAVVECGPSENMVVPGADFILSPVDDTTPTETPTSTPTSTPTTPPAEAPNGFYDEGSYTGNSAIDPVINTVYAQNGNVIASLMKADADGEFSYSACQPEWVTIGEGREMLADAITSEQLYVYAVYADPRSPVDEAAYRVIFGTALDESGISIDINESGKIVDVVVCGAPANMLGLPGTSYLLTPTDGTPLPTRTATATATPTRTAIATPTRQVPNPPNTGTGFDHSDSGNGSGDTIGWALLIFGASVFAIAGLTGMRASHQRRRR